MSTQKLWAIIGILMLILAGIAKLYLREWECGLLLMGFAVLLWSNIRLQERLRSDARQGNRVVALTANQKWA